MSQNLLDLHIMAAESQIHHAHLAGGLITDKEYKQKIELLKLHCNIITEPHHCDRDCHYREILDGAIRLADTIRS